MRKRDNFAIFIVFVTVLGTLGCQENGHLQGVWSSSVFPDFSLEFHKNTVTVRGDDEEYDLTFSILDEEVILSDEESKYFTFEYNKDLNILKYMYVLLFPKNSKILNISPQKEGVEWSLQDLLDYLKKIFPDIKYTSTHQSRDSRFAYFDLYTGDPIGDHALYLNATNSINDARSSVDLAKRRGEYAFSWGKFFFNYKHNDETSWQNAVLVMQCLPLFYPDFEL